MQCPQGRTCRTLLKNDCVRLYGVCPHTKVLFTLRVSCHQSHFSQSPSILLVKSSHSDNVFSSRRSVPQWIQSISSASSAGNTPKPRLHIPRITVLALNFGLDYFLSFARLKLHQCHNAQWPTAGLRSGLVAAPRFCASLGDCVVFWRS